MPERRNHPRTVHVSTGHGPRRHRHGHLLPQCPNSRPARLGSWASPPSAFSNLGSTLGPPLNSSRQRPISCIRSPRRNPGEETALGRSPPGTQRPRDQLRRGVRPLQPRCPRDRRCCPTSPLATLAGDEHHQDTRYSLPLVLPSCCAKPCAQTLT